ncbi:MAG: hypothetical protein ACFFCQ_01765 [Promethearchaeota archaeon]
MNDNIPNVWESVENNVLKFWSVTEMGFLQVFVTLIIYSSLILILIVPLLGKVILFWGIFEYTSEWNPKQGFRRIIRGIFVLSAFGILEESIPSTIRNYHMNLSQKELPPLIDFFELITDGLLYICAMLSLFVIMIALLSIILANSSGSRSRAVSRFQRGIFVLLLIIVPILLSYMIV